MVFFYLWVIFNKKNDCFWLEKVGLEWFLGIGMQTRPGTSYGFMP